MKMKTWQKALNELNCEKRNNNRKHDYHRDDMDTTVVDRQLEEDEITPPAAKMLKLSNHEDWLDIIYSRKPEDLHELVTDEAVSAAIRKLTSPQKEVLFLNTVHQFTVAEIAAMKGVSERNIRKIRQRAIEGVHRFLEVLGDRRGEGTADCVVPVLIFNIFCLVWWPLNSFLAGWFIAKWIYPRIKAKLIVKEA